MLLYHILFLLRISHRWFYFSIFSLVIWYDCISNFSPKGPIHLKYCVINSKIWFKLPYYTTCYCTIFWLFWEYPIDDFIFSLVIWYDCISNFGPKGPIHLKYLHLCRFMRTCLGWSALMLKGLSNTGSLTALSGLLGSRKRGPLLKGRTCEIWDLASRCYVIASELCTVLVCITLNFSLRNSRIY